jgi:starch phosphorylase
MREIGGDPFNMTVAGLRLARIANGVSQLHGVTSRKMWAPVRGAAPIISITNGVHTPSWQSDRIRAAGDDAEALWAAHRVHKEDLVAEVEARQRLRLDPESLFIGFARRAAGYKRSDFILRDEQRLKRLLERHKVCILFSGKAHPDDAVGKAIVSRMVAAEQRYPGRIVFLENHDMALARQLTRGCDVWLNNPIRPLEASGTSGMKAGMNGLLNLSILDGWWPEGCQHGVNGWAIGDENSGDDARDLEALYEVLEDEVLPAWADRAHWTRMMQASIAMATQQFSAERMVREYFEKLYAEDPSVPVPPVPSPTARISTATVPAPAAPGPARPVATSPVAASPVHPSSDAAIPAPAASPPASSAPGSPASSEPARGDPAGPDTGA